MSNAVNLLRDYIIQNKIVYLTYGIITVLFYGVSYVLFSESIDVPFDNILIMLYITFSPGFMAVITMYRGRVTLVFSNATYYYNVVIQTIFVLLFNFIALTIYDFFRVNKGYYWEDDMWFMLIIAIPIILIGMIVSFEAKLRFENLRLKIVFLIGAIFLWYVLDLLFNQTETRFLYYGINVIYFIVIPLFLIVYWYRKRLVKM